MAERENEDNEFLDLLFSSYDPEGEACFNVLDKNGVNIFEDHAPL